MTMTIEIKQLVIRAVVDERRGPKVETQPLSAERTSPPPVNSSSTPLRRQEREAMVTECMRRVLRELRRRRER